jgi:hypothetical protein
MIQQRSPAVANALVARFESDRPAPPTFRSVMECAAVVAGDGFATPSWRALAEGARPDPPPTTQSLANGATDGSSMAFRSGSLLPRLSRPACALLRSQSGPGACSVFTTPPTSPLTTLDASAMRTLLLRRLRLPLLPTSRSCRCRRFLDPFGDHRAACSTSGVLVRRGFPLEAAAARMCREAGARVALNVPVRDLNISNPVGDGRRLEVVANNLPLYNGAQLAIDVTLVSPLRGDGTACPGAHATDGIAAARACRRKAVTYPELTGALGRARLVVLALEVGGRWGPGAVRFIRLLARARARSSPAVLRASARLAWQRRWTALLSFAAQRAFAHSLLELPLGGAGCLDGPTPPLGDVLADARWSVAPVLSRLV